MHENCRDEAGLKGGHEQRDRDVGLLCSEIDVRESNGNSGKDDKSDADQEITTNVFRDIVGVVRSISSSCSS